MTPEERRLWHQATLTAIAARLELARAGLKLQAIAEGRCSTATVHHALHAKNVKITTLLDIADGVDHDVVITFVPRTPAA